MKNLLRLVIIIAGIAIGPGLVVLVYEIIKNFSSVNPYTDILSWVNLCVFIASGFITGIIFVFLSSRIVEAIRNFVADIEEYVSNVPPRTVLAGGVGLVFGLLVAFLLSMPINRIPITWLAVPITVIVYIICAYLGVRIAVKSVARISGRPFRTVKVAKKGKEEEATAQPSVFAPKILDTSVIIDGRIFDLLQTGVIEGTIVIPEFVLGELRHIADSADALKRNKGRRGLDILSKIQKELDIPVEISAKDYEDIQEVDAKLLRLAQDMGGKVLTNDFNLNKVAAVQGVSVFNINELSNAVKPVLLPGEELQVTVIKEGKEQGQGVAYLEDGTMIVVENARDKIGETLEVVVTSALQTAAGRMIFAKIKEEA